MLSPHLGWVKPGSMVFYVWSRSQHSFSISSSDLCRDIASHIAPKATDIDKATEIAQNCMISNSYEPRITLRWVVMARIQVFFANRKANNIFDRKKKVMMAWNEGEQKSRGMTWKSILVHGAWAKRHYVMATLWTRESQVSLQLGLGARRSRRRTTTKIAISAAPPTRSSKRKHGCMADKRQTIETAAKSRIFIAADRR